MSADTNTSDNKSDKAQAPRKPSAKARRASARLLAVQAIYQASLNEQPIKSAAQEYLDHRIGMSVDGEEIVAPDKALFTKIMNGVAERKTDLGEIIQANMAGKTGEQAEPLIKSILMCAAYELLAHHDTDAPVIINDYLNVGHAFFAKPEVGLINGVLDGVNKALRS